MTKLTSTQIVNKSNVNGASITDALNELISSLGDGSGDMLKAIYDTDNDGVVDVAETANSVLWNNIDSKPTLFPPQTHNHPISEVTNLQTELSGKAAVTHSHAISDVTGLQTQLDGKAAASHTHAISDVTGLQTNINSKQDVLVSGENLKTINGESLLGSGNIVITGGGGSTDHGALTGLADDDHTQYHTDARGDARYSQLGHTHSNATTSVDGFMSASDKTKLDGVANGATANSSDATLLNRANHTGTQAISTVTNLQTTLDGKEPSLPAGGTTSQYLSGDKAWTDFASSVRSALLTGFTSGPNSAVVATDNVLQAIQKLQAQITSGGGGGATIKAIQRGTIVISASGTSATATITAVDMAKTELRFLGGSGYTSGSVAMIPRIVLTNTTTITATSPVAVYNATTISWELTEWN